MSQTLSFHLPSNSGSASVITPAIQKEVVAAAVAAITLASGQAPSNMTVVPTFSTSSSDGSITISFLIDSTLSKIVNTTMFISAAAYAADPIGSTAIAVKSATGGSGVQSASISLTTAARQAATSVCALANATTTLVSRIATVIQINASSIIATGVCAKVEDAIISNVFGVVTTGADSAGSATAAAVAAGLSLSEILQSGGVAGVCAALIVLFIIYTMARRNVKNSDKNNNVITSRVAKIKSLTSSPLPLTQQPRPPKSDPPKHAFTSFQQAHSENNPGSVNNSDKSLATIVNPLRQHQQVKATSLPRRRSRGELNR